MKIAIDISPLESEHKFRGVGFYIENLIAELQKLYSDTHSFTYFTHGDKLPNKLDMVHYPYFDPFFFTYPFPLSCPVVITIHDLTPLVFPKEFPAGVKGRIKWLTQKRKLANVHAIITDSESSKRDIIRLTHAHESKVHVVYLAAGNEFREISISDKRKKELIKKYNLPERFGLYVGDVTWNKNLPRLIKAVTKADISFVMVGSALVQKEYNRTNSWNKDRMKVEALLKQNNNIIAVGFIPKDDLVALYNLATLFVMPSLYEGFGLPILEAMATGCPVITTKEGSLAEVAGDAAYYVDAYDVDSIASGIKKVFTDRKLRDELCEKGLLQASKFSWEKTAENTKRVYTSVYRTDE